MPIVLVSNTLLTSDKSTSLLMSTNEVEYLKMDSIHNFVQLIWNISIFFTIVYRLLPVDKQTKTDITSIAAMFGAIVKCWPMFEKFLLMLISAVH